MQKLKQIPKRIPEVQIKQLEPKKMSLLLNGDPNFYISFADGFRRFYWVDYNLPKGDRSLDGIAEVSKHKVWVNDRLCQEMTVSEYYPDGSIGDRSVFYIWHNEVFYGFVMQIQPKLLPIH